jgi:hypothetical protein
MNQTVLWLFIIPIVSIVIMGIYQICHEMFKEHFVLERRKARSSDPAAGVERRRRYSDSVPPGTLRNPENGASANNLESSTPKVRAI